MTKGSYLNYRSIKPYHWLKSLHKKESCFLVKWETSYRYVENITDWKFWKYFINNGNFWNQNPPTDPSVSGPLPNNELWLNVKTSDLYNSMSHPTGVAGPSDNAPISKETEILKRLKSKLTNLEPYEETIVLKLEEM